MDSLSDVINEIVRKNGKEIFANERLFRSVFADYCNMNASIKPWQKQLCQTMVSAGLVKRLTHEPHLSTREKNLIIQTFVEEYAADEKKATAVYTVILNALFEDLLSEKQTEKPELSAESEPAREAELYRKAAEKGHVIAQYNLGVCYFEGWGVPQDQSKAIEWYRKVAESGFAYAQFNLGVCYENGNGVKQDYSKAVEWYRKAAAQGNADAQYNLGICYEIGRGVPQDQSKAVEWYRKATEQGHADAQCNLGFCYEKGRGVPQDYSKAVEWFRKAAEQGYCFAMFFLGASYERGEGVPQDDSKAAEWHKKSVEQGHAGVKKQPKLLGFKN